ncbi:hypothetical protein ACLOJK_007372 [Asimina triloba]
MRAALYIGSKINALFRRVIDHQRPTAPPHHGLIRMSYERSFDKMACRAEWRRFVRSYVITRGSPTTYGPKGVFGLLYFYPKVRFDGLSHARFLAKLETASDTLLKKRTMSVLPVLRKHGQTAPKGI